MRAPVREMTLVDRCLIPFSCQRRIRRAPCGARAHRLGLGEIGGVESVGKLGMSGGCGRGWCLMLQRHPILENERTAQAGVPQCVQHEILHRSDTDVGEEAVLRVGTCTQYPYHSLPLIYARAAAAACWCCAAPLRSQKTTYAAHSDNNLQYHQSLPTYRAPAKLRGGRAQARIRRSLAA